MTSENRRAVISLEIPGGIRHHNPSPEYPWRSSASSRFVDSVGIVLKGHFLLVMVDGEQGSRLAEIFRHLPLFGSCDGPGANA